MYNIYIVREDIVTMAKRIIFETKLEKPFFKIVEVEVDISQVFGHNLRDNLIS